MNTLMLPTSSVSISDPLVFDEKTKCAYITAEQLGQTILLEDANGKLPKATPVEHVTVLRQILGMAKELGLVVAPHLITISENNVRRLQWKGPKNECPLQNYLIERLVTKIDLVERASFTGRSDAAGVMSAAMSYTDRGGIQVAFGHNVSICQNLNIWGETIFSTAGNDKSKIDYEKGMQLLYGWLQNSERLRREAEIRIEQLMATPVSEGTRGYLIGRLFENAVRANSGDKDAFAPLNQSDCAALVRAGYDKLTQEQEITAWDLTNWATSVIKPERMDMSGMLISNHRINEFIYNELCLS